MEADTAGDWGGKRPKAGRPRDPNKHLKDVISLTLLLKTIADLRAVAAVLGMQPGPFLDLHLQKYPPHLSVPTATQSASCCHPGSSSSCGCPSSSCAESGPSAEQGPKPTHSSAPTPAVQAASAAPVAQSTKPGRRRRNQKS